MENCKCCETCKFFQEDTGFCRYNPPTPIQIERDGVKYMSAMYPVIDRPSKDYCSKYLDNFEFC